MIQDFAVTNSIAQERQDPKFLWPSQKSLRTELWSFIMEFMLKIDPKKRVSAKECLEAGKLTVFNGFYTTETEGQRTPTGRQHDGSSPSASDPAVEDATDEDGTDEDGIDEDGTDEDGTDEDGADGDGTADPTTALPNAPTVAANSSNSQTPDIALLDRHKTRFGRALMDYMKS